MITNGMKILSYLLREPYDGPKWFHKLGDPSQSRRTLDNMSMGHSGAVPVICSAWEPGNLA